MAGFPANFKEWAEVPSPEMKNFWVIATFAGKAFCGGVVNRRQSISSFIALVEDSSVRL